MSIWLLVVFAFCMATAVVSFGAVTAWAQIAVPLFVATLLVFLGGVWRGGIRRPVV